MKRTVTACLLVALLAQAGCKGRSAKEQKSSSASGGDAAVAGPRKVSAEVLWRTPYKGRLRVLAVAGSSVVVTSRGKSDRSSARRLAGFDSATGKLLWEKVTRVRFFERSVPWSVSVARSGGVLAVAKTAHRVAGFDPRTGARKWQTHATGGVVAAGGSFVLGHFGEVRLVRPADGAEILRMALDDRRSGGSGNGLSDELRPGTMLNGFPGGLLLTRNHGAPLQALDGRTLAGRWQYRAKGALSGRPDRLAVGRKAVLLPVLQPRREDESTLSAWPAFGSRPKPLWTATIPGRVSRRLTFVTPAEVLGISRTRARLSLLWRVDRRSGKLLEARPVPTPHFCHVGVRGGRQLLVCKHREEVSVHDVATGKRLWRYRRPRGRSIRSMRYADGSVVLEVGPKLLVMDLLSGQQRFAVLRRLGEHRYRVMRLLGVSGGRLLVAVRLLEGKTWGDPLLLLGLSLATGAVELQKRLGRYPRQGAPVWPGAPEKLPGTLPVILVRAQGSHPDRVFSVFGKTFQVLDASTGRSLFARGIPPQRDRVVRLLRRDGDKAVYRRGNGLFGVSLKDHRLLWRASLWKAPLHRAFGHRAFLKGRKGELEARPRLAPDPDARGLSTLRRERCRLRFAEPRRWFCQTSKNLLVLDSRTGVVGARLGRAHNVFRAGDLMLASYTSSHKVSRPSMWVALDLHTGKVLWKRESGADQGARSPLPPPFDRERPSPARWTWAGLGLFLVTSADGRCVHAVAEATGKAVFVRCFGALAGPPVALGNRLLLAARPSRATGSRPAARQPLFLLSAATGEAKQIFDPGAGRRLVLGAAPVGGVLYATIRPASGVTTRNQVVALRLLRKVK